MMRPPSGATAPDRPHRTKGTPSLTQPPHLRPVIRAFVDASETLLSPALTPPDLTPKECEAVAQSVIALSGATAPWCECLLDGLHERLTGLHEQRKQQRALGRRMH